MIATVTLNPALDKTVFVEGLQVGDTNRVRKVELDAGGKGINASRMLAVLGEETIALGFVGGRAGRFITSDLAEEGIPTDFIQTRVETRTNVAIEDLNGNPPTTLNEKGGPILPEELEQLKEKIKYWAGKSRIMIFAGSIPQGIDTGIYRDLIAMAQKEGAQAILDADGEPLILGIESHPVMIKPNRAEAERICGKKLTATEDVAEAAKNRVQQGVEIVVVSMGKHGAVAATKDEVWHAVPPSVETISTIGSGDSMVAGIAAAIARGETLAQALALGSAAGAATAMSSGVEMGKRADIDRLLPNVILKRM